MSGNGIGAPGGRRRMAHETPQMLMDAFDRLPATLRLVVRESPFEWPTHTLLEYVEDGCPVADLVELIWLRDAEAIERMGRH